MEVKIALAILGLLGIGTLLRALVLHCLARRAAKDDRSYAEKRETFLKFLDAWRARAEYAEDYSYWRSRVELLGSPRVIKRVRGLEIADSYSREDVANAYPLLLDAMRKDLGKGPSEDI